ncbi:MAG: RES domain-containing protein [Dehalococcoidia bacterium]
MAVDSDLLAAVDACPRSAWSGTVYRHTAPHRDPLSTIGAQLNGGRWNPKDLFGALYLADSQETCQAEFERMAESQGLSPADFLPRDLHVLEVSGLVVLDLRDPSIRARIGLSDAILSADGWKPCQDVAAAAHFLGFGGIVAPSATGTGFVVAAFDGRSRLGQVRLVRTESLSIELAPLTPDGPEMRT